MTKVNFESAISFTKAGYNAVKELGNMELNKKYLDLIKELTDLYVTAEMESEVNVNE